MPSHHTRYTYICIPMQKLNYIDLSRSLLSPVSFHETGIGIGWDKGPGQAGLAGLAWSRNVGGRRHGSKQARFFFFFSDTRSAAR